MKVLAFAFSVFFSLNLLASEKPGQKYMSIEEQDAFMVNVAKKIRRGYWVSGHEEVSSSTSFLSKKGLDEIVERSNRFEDFIDEVDLEGLYTCIKSSSCELYLVGTSSEYWGGYGMTNHYVKLFTKSQKYYDISHVVYAE